MEKNKLRMFNEGPVEILLVEDNPGDVRLTREIFKECNVPHVLHVVKDGEEAMAFLRQEGDYQDVKRPALILLDLNLPCKDGREVLAEIKKDGALQRIPIVVLTTSAAKEDIFQAYQLHANCYILKPVDLDQFQNVVQGLSEFWLRIVELPSRYE